ncbi:MULTISPECIES: helix-turn-helix transcriptional regulator [Brevibacillus]|uniref:helix-turn-helix transcriptional regulator n=1 Tax=Brevibacillus TaxID=55080 RepID=UPI0004F2F849|nr:AlpA family phage regulatory protein [Brevibacillus borstelensis]KKX53286.1 hypothetical protein X546_20645 [Brevibacillus borstelensis cifa_chp40]
MQVNLDDIMGLYEVSEMTGKSKTYIKEYLKRGKFPQPIKVLACGPLWLREQVQVWMDTPSTYGKRKQ